MDTQEVPIMGEDSRAGAYRQVTVGEGTATVRMWLRGNEVNVTIRELDAEEYLTTQQAAALLGWTVRRVRTAARRGTLPARRYLDGREWEFILPQLSAWAAEHGIEVGGR
jgi:excisionase family DNA binding protein